MYINAYKYTYKYIESNNRHKSDSMDKTEKTK